MADLTRREWSAQTIGGLVTAMTAPFAGAAAGQRQDPRNRGVTIGVQSYSFRDRPLDGAIEAMARLGLRSCELWSRHVEPAGGLPRDELRRWRETVSLDEFRRVREKFARAGIALSAFMMDFRDDCSDAEIERGFEMAEALGAPVMTSSANIMSVRRVAEIAARHTMRVGMHNHSRIDPNEFATPANFEEAMRAGPYIAINLDIGHFTAANFDAIEFLRAHHAHIVSLHVKDRKRDQGPNVAFGQGDTPIGAVLRLLRDEKWAIPANIEYEYKGGDTIEEVRTCLDFCRRTLDG